MSRYIDADQIEYDDLIREDLDEVLTVAYWKDIKEMPTADVKPVVYGKWIYNKTSTLWECSNCHEEEIRSTTYCPHCGARNRGGR